ncbi:MAG TPA: choice-of-anchor tandem repeat GloVer-containing protein [Terriglobales bacterium]
MKSFSLTGFRTVTLLVAWAIAAPAQTFTTLHSFGGIGDGAAPYTGLVGDHAGNVYGTTLGGGPDSAGAVFKITNATTGNSETVLHFFTFADGGDPQSTLIRDKEGNLYGTALLGGAYSYGSVFKLDTAGKITVLYSFTGGADGWGPIARLLRDPEGTLYGTTLQGGTFNAGVVFKLDVTGKETVLYNFAGGADGRWPAGGLIRDEENNFYGVTEYGGTFDFGIVFKLDTAGNETVLHTFAGGEDGGYPNGPLVRDAAGNLYGTTHEEGTFRAGVIFKIDPSGQETILHTFDRSDGLAGSGNLIADEEGNLYGVTNGGGSYGYGVAFRLDPSGNLSLLHSFNGGTDGSFPWGGLIRDNAGNLYGTTSSGGAFDLGTAFKLTP